jgi:protein TonB
MDEKDDTFEHEPSEDLYLRSPAPLSSEPSRVDEIAWDSSGEQRHEEGLLYEPLEEDDGESAVPPGYGPVPSDNSPLLFRLALSTAALLVLFVLARGFWWPGEEPRGNPPEWAAAPNLPPPARTPAPTARPAPKPRPADTIEIAEPVAEPSLVEEVASPAPPPKPRKPEPVIVKPEPAPVIVEEVSPKPVPSKPAVVVAEKAKTERPKPVTVKPAAAPKETRETEKVAALPERAAVSAPAPSVQARRIPHPWEEGPQPSDLLKPGPGVEEPVPLDFPRYSYPSAARGTGLRADVKLAVLVDERGRVIDARVREGAPPDLGFVETAMAAAKRISFQPASRYDIPGKMWTEVILEFVE